MRDVPVEARNTFQQIVRMGGIGEGFERSVRFIIMVFYTNLVSSEYFISS